MEIREYLVTKKEDIKQLQVKPRQRDIRASVNFISSVIGPRRAGKTYFLYYVIKKLGLEENQYLFVNFEEEVSMSALSELPFIHQEIYGVQPEYVFLDEVQSYENWERGVYTLHERRRYKIYITGSSSKLLAYEISSKLRGRAIPTLILPFSVGETLLAMETNLPNIYNKYEVNQFKSTLREKIFNGFYPDVVLGNIKARDFYENYLDLVIYKDILERFDIKNRVALEYLIKSALNSNSKNFSINKLFNSLKSRGIKVSKNTLYNFQRILEDINLFIFLRKYDPSLRKIEQSIPKVYAIDTGLAYHNANDQTITKLLEQLVLLEFVKGGLRPNKDLFYWRSKQGYEVDFLKQKKDRITELIQVTYANSLDEIERREIRGLIKASETFNCKNLTILSWDYEDTLVVEGKRIKILPVWKWIMNRISS